MNRALISILLTTLVFSACMSKKSDGPIATRRDGSGESSDQRQSTTESAGNGSALAAPAAKITDVCSVMPADLVQKIVPGASAPQSEQYPRRCSVSNGTSVLEITIETGIIVPVDPVNGAEFIPGLAEGGYLERLDPHSRGDTYLTVILGKDPKGLLHVEVAGHDGKDHKEDAIAVAREILSRLH